MTTRLAVAWTLLGTLAALVTSAYAAPPDDSQSIRTRIAWQIALDRVGFSPGIIDGKIGAKAQLATREFQLARGLAVTGALDAPTTAALGVDAEKAVGLYAIQPVDLQAVGVLPKSWLEKSRQQWLPYATLEEVIAERFHCHRALLAGLNPGVDFASVKVGDEVVVPNVDETVQLPPAGRIEINLDSKIVRVYGEGGGLIALLHCSVAADKDNLPSVPKTAVAVVAFNPVYRFDPAKWPEVKDVHEKLLIPPGPRNPVGLCWMGLALAGYGMHGTPTPEMIGKTGSHGCFRLANWDAVRLGKIVRVGLPVTFVKGPDRAAAAPTVAAAPADEHPPFVCGGIVTSLPADAPPNIAHAPAPTPAPSPTPAAPPAPTAAPVPAAQPSRLPMLSAGATSQPAVQNRFPRSGGIAWE